MSETTWKTAELGELGTILTGSTPPTKNSEYFNGKVPFVSPSDLGKRKYISEAQRTLSELGFREAQRIPTGSVLVTCIGSTIGKIGIAATPLATNQQINSLIPNQMACSEFVFYQLQRLAPLLRKLAGCQAVPIINKSTLSSIAIQLPSLAEQNKIAEILTCWDKAIELVERLIEEKKSFKRAVASRMIIRFNADKLPEYALGDLFQGVERRSTTDGLPVLSITAGKGFVDQREKFSRVIAGDSLKRYIQLNRGEFAYNKGNSDRFPFGCIYRLKEVDSGLVPFVYFCFSARDQRVNGEFFEHYLQAGALDRQLNKAINSGVRNDGLMNLSRDDFFAAKIHLPPKNLQSSYGALLSKLSEESSLLRTYRQALVEQKRGLMQQLLTGKKRVEV